MQHHANNICNAGTHTRSIFFSALRSVSSSCCKINATQWEEIFIWNKKKINSKQNTNEKKSAHQHINDEHAAVANEKIQWKTKIAAYCIQANAEKTRRSEWVREARAIQHTKSHIWLHIDWPIGWFSFTRSLTTIYQSTTDKTVEIKSDLAHMHTCKQCVACVLYTHLVCHIWNTFCVCAH